MRRSIILSREAEIRLRSYDLKPVESSDVISNVLIDKVDGYEFHDFAGALAHIDQCFAQLDHIVSYNIKGEGLFAYINVKKVFYSISPVYTGFYVRQCDDKFEIRYSVFPAEHLK